ncbi:hypothetical protein D3C86_1990890 [compost metagenome]
MIGVEIPLRIEQFVRLVAVGTDTGVHFAALGQAHGAQVRFGADVQFDPRWFKDLPQHVPAKPVAIGGGVVFPLFAGQVNHGRRRRGLSRVYQRAKQGEHHHHQPA